MSDKNFNVNVTDTICGIEDFKSKDGKEFLKLYVIGPEVNNDVLKGRVVRDVVWLDKQNLPEIVGKLSVGSGIRVLKEGQKGFERVSLIICTEPVK